MLLTEQQKQQNPFKGYEKVIYKAGDSTIAFDGTGRTNRIQHEIISINSCDWNVREYDELNFTNNSYNIHFQMSGRNNFSIGLNGNGNDIFFSSSYYVANDPASNSNYNEFIDTLKIDNDLYFNIYKDTLHHYSSDDIPDSLNHATYLYYSTEYGIVKFDFSDGSTWELKEIVW